MIRQAISCDICGSEKKQTNHWFIAYERNDELRMAGWEGAKTQRSNLKHLCGQKCVHRLLDEFMASHAVTAGHAAAAPAENGTMEAHTEVLVETTRLIPTPGSLPEAGAILSTHPGGAQRLTDALPRTDTTTVSKSRDSAWERERALLKRTDGAAAEHGRTRFFSH